MILDLHILWLDPSASLNALFQCTFCIIIQVQRPDECTPEVVKPIFRNWIIIIITHKFIQFWLWDWTQAVWKIDGGVRSTHSSYFPRPLEDFQGQQYLIHSRCLAYAGIGASGLHFVGHRSHSGSVTSY